MVYVSAEARQQLLDEIATSVDQIGVAVAALSDAYEQLDEQSADRLEEQLFRPVQAAYGRARRAHSEFADRYALPRRPFAPESPVAAERGVRALLDAALEAVEDADLALGELQDSMLPVEVGDEALRAGLAEVRRSLGDLAARGRRFLGLLGR